MICKNCGGVLDFVNGHYECQSCGNVLHPEIVIQHFDVCICCIENDELGRRTQDSIIAQDVYQKLKFNNINAFFSRVDSADMIGDDLEISNDLAMFNSDVLIFVGIQKEHFEQLLEENKAKELNKIIIPVISKMNANDLPQELKSIQVMNYDNIGAISDLTNAVLKLLGREKEIELAKIHDKAAKKKKIITLCSVLVVLLIAASGTLYYVFGTDKVLDSKKYETAMTYVEKNDYVNALPILSALGDYQDCKKIISEYYKSFSGFYYDKDNSTGYRISINDDSVGIEIKKRDGIKTNTFSEAKEGVIFPIEFSYVDTENNQGIINVSLENDSIHFETKINEKVSDFCFDEGNHTFSKNDKTDEEANNATYKDYLNVLLDGNFNKTLLLGVDFCNCNLRKSRFKNAVLNNVCFINCNLEGVDFTNSIFQNVVFICTNIDQTNNFPTKGSFRMYNSYPKITIHSQTQEELLALSLYKELYEPHVLHVSQNKLNYWTLKVLIDVYGEDIFRALSAVKNRNNKKCFYTVFSYMKHVEKYLKI
nr:pentapeptide repeat-containing protein [Eubacteriales bacterium]